MPPFDIRDRTFQFACAIVRFYLYLLQETATPRRLADQLLYRRHRKAFVQSFESKGHKAHNT